MLEISDDGPSPCLIRWKVIAGLPSQRDYALLAGKAALLPAARLRIIPTSDESDAVPKPERESLHDRDKAEIRG